MLDKRRCLLFPQMILFFGLARPVYSWTLKTIAKNPSTQHPLHTHSVQSSWLFHISSLHNRLNKSAMCTDRYPAGSSSALSIPSTTHSPYNFQQLSLSWSSKIFIWRRKREKTRERGPYGFNIRPEGEAASKRAEFLVPICRRPIHPPTGNNSTPKEPSLLISPKKKTQKHFSHAFFQQLLIY